MIPSQNTGSETPISASTVINRSDNRPAVTAEITPTRIPKKSQMIAGPIESENVTGMPCQIWQGIPVTFSLSIGPAIIWLFFGILVGVISAVTAGRLSDRLITVLALIGVSLPVFWLGIILRYLLAEKNSIFPDGGYVPLTSNPAQWFFHLILPWFTLAVL